MDGYSSVEVWHLLVCRGLGHHPTFSMEHFCDTQMRVPFSATGDFVDPSLSANVEADARYRITISVDLDDHALFWKLDMMAGDRT